MSGTATDETGAVLVNATLALSNVRTQAKYEVRTDQSGAFEFVGLPAGDYAFEARVLGFEPLKEDVSVGVGESLHKNVALKIGTVQEAITVTADREAGRFKTRQPRGHRPSSHGRARARTRPSVDASDLP